VGLSGSLSGCVLLTAVVPVPQWIGGVSVSTQGPGSDLGLEGCLESRGGTDLPATAPSG